MKSSKLLVLCAIILAESAAMLGQTQPNVENGFKPYGSYGGGDLDSVDLQHGSLILHIPMPFSYPQRGSLSAPNVLRLSSNAWSIQHYVAPNGGSTDYWSLGAGPGGNLAQMGTGVGVDSTLDLSPHRYFQSESGPGAGYSSFGHYITTWNGGLHQLHSPPNAPVDANGTPMSFDSIDASGYHLDLSNPNTTGVPASAIITDRHGNRYFFDKWAAYCGKPVSEGQGSVTLPTLSAELTKAMLQWEIEFNILDPADFPNGEFDPFGGSLRHAALVDQSGDNTTAGSTTVTTCQEAGRIISITDANGNVISTFWNATPQDTMGRPPDGFVPAAPSLDFSGCVSPSASTPLTSVMVYNYQGVGGASYQFKVCMASFPIQTNFGVSGVVEYQNEATYLTNGVTAAPLVVTVILSDAPNWTGTHWTFNYDGYLNPTDIGLPSGGSIHYDWTQVADPTCGGRTPVSRAVKTRTVNDNNGNSFKWSYNWGAPSGGVLSNTVTDPLNNDTVHVFTAQEGANGCMFYETSTRSYQGASSQGTPLKQVDTTYQPPTLFTDVSGGNGGFGNIVPTSIQTTIKQNGSNKVSLLKRTYDQGPGNGLPIFGDVVKEQVYDWGVNSPGPLLRETDTTYQWQTNSAYLSAHLVDLPATVIVKDGSLCALAETDYTYDEPAYLTNYEATVAALPSGTHVAAPNSVSGNLTTVTKYLAPAGSCNPKGGAAIASHGNWYNTGEAHQQIDPAGRATTHSYDPFYAGAYSTQTCSPTTNAGATTHCVSGTYDFSTGLLTSFTNENATQQASGNTPGDGAHTTSYNYDSLFRLTSVTTPPDVANGGAQAQTLFTYSLPNVFPMTVQQQKSITSSMMDSVTTTYDGLGRPYKTQHPLPNGIAEVDTTYDGLSHMVTVTNPYFSTSDPTYGVVQSQYDALGRATQVTQQDGSIRTVAYSVTPIQAAPGDCTQSTDEAGKQRLTCSDALGRLIEVHEPGDSFSGSQASGAININGTLGSQSGVGATGASQATGQITISGGNQFLSGGKPVKCPPRQICDQSGNPYYDNGKVYITVNGHEYDYWFGGGGNGPGDHASSVAQGLVTAIQSDAGRVVNASVPANGTVITLTAVNSGSAGNSIALTTGDTWDTSTWSTPSFTASPLNSNLSGGTDSYPGVTIYDQGTVTVTVGTFSASASYSQGGNSTAMQIASALAGTGPTGLNRSGSPVTAGANGAQINLTYNAVGSAGNLAVTASAQSTQTQWTFSPPSFSGSNTTLSGGYNAEGASLDFNYFVTQYAYDGLGNLLTVTQKGDPTVTTSGQWRVRSFSYDTLGRLLTAYNPESGTICYGVWNTPGGTDVSNCINGYDANGNLLHKTSPAPNQTGTATQTISYCYDELNRITGRAFSAQNCSGTQLPAGTAVVSYAYDSGANAKGKLTSFTDQAGSGSYTYDVLGRMATESRTINPGPTLAAVAKNMSYAYNLDGSLKTLTYPSGAAVTYTPDSAGRMLQAVDSTNGINYVTGASYGPDSGLTGFISGSTGGFAGITNSVSYNKRLQPINMSAASPSQTVFSIGYDFHVGNGTSGSDNGNVWGITNYKDNTRNQSFTYDALNRLTAAQNAGTNCAALTVNGKTEYWGNSYGYDAWGNLLQKTVTKCNAENLSVIALANNQLSGYTYDAAGNMTSDPTDSVTPTYDQENRIATATKNGVSTTYTYDDDGNRVEKTSSGAGTLYWYMSPGIVAESDLSGNLQSEYVFFDGERVARKDFPGLAVSYYFSDHLKTASVITDSAGNIKSESDYYPWGGELQFIANDSNHYKFTGKERDSETGLDYFGARYYSNGLGRFITPDWSATPVPVPYSDLTDPQTLNLYGYVRGLPTSKTDIDGHGFWNKVGNLFRQDGCWCEDGDYVEHQAAEEGKRQKAAAEHEKWRQQFAKENGFDPDEAMQGFAMAYAGVQAGFGNGPEPEPPAPVSEEEPVVEVTISRSKSPASAQHIDEAQAAGHPEVVTLDRKGTQGAARAAARGRAATRGMPTAPGMDRDEYPPKCCAEGGAKASGRSIPRSDNRSGGGQMGQQTKTLPDGTKIRIKTRP